MAASTLSIEPAAPPPEVLPWLKTLPLAPEYYPTLAEFQDPIAYIFKIEKEASQYGICKIIPPLPPAPKKSVISNLNRSLIARAAVSGSSTSKSSPTFTTRQQQIGFCPRKSRPVQKPVWQSGENYSFPEFEAKAKSFEKNYLKKCIKKGPLSALEIETLYWKATVDKPFSVEYANDMPGSAFSSVSGKKAKAGVVGGEGVTVAETEWNMRGVSRGKGSLLRFMKEEIPGVTSPMVYVAMLFSWFAWHVEDHDLHSLNYLHMGAGKTWYGVPREAAVAFEEVVRVHGYNGEINPLVTFFTLGEKTTVMSPEVFVGEGVPCCRLVQNAGEFVVTFPRAYHTGFSHGFNCGEAANIATPEWLRVAKDAAIRRASINYPPMVSHFQLLYDLALALCSRIPMSVSANPRSSRLKDKKKGEGETLVKELFVQNVIQNNDLLHILGKGSSIVLLPQSSSDISVCSDLRVGSQIRNPGMSLGSYSYKEAMKSCKGLVSDDIMLGRNHGINPVKGFYSAKGKFASLCERNRRSSISGNDIICNSTSQTQKTDNERESTGQGDGLSDQRLFSCVMCGILSFACVAVIQPKEEAARYLMSADCSFFNDWIVGSGVTSDGFNVAGADANASEQDSCTRRMEKTAPAGLFDVPVQSVDYQIQRVDQSNIVASDTETQRGTSALGLLALNYGNSSDSEEEHIEPDVSVYGDDTNLTNYSSRRNFQHDNSDLPSFRQDFHGGETEGHSLSLSRLDCGDEVPLQIIDYVEAGCRRANFKGESSQAFDSSEEFETDDLDSIKSKNFEGAVKDPMVVSHITSNCFPVAHGAEKMKTGKAIVPLENTDMSFSPRSDEDSSRMHVFCLEHAVEVEQQLRPIGGVQILLLCHPEYPKIEAEAKLAAQELGIDYPWNNISFSDATKEDEERIQSALDSEEAIPGNGDWAVKLGINLFYSANLSRSPLYSKQMPYNSVIYNAFGRSSPATSPTKINIYGRKPGRQKKVVAGKWCGKVWMSNQVHPFLAKRDPEEQERSFRAWATSDEHLEKKSESIHKTETPLVTRKFGRKRKMTAESGSTKKVKCIETEDAVSDDFLEDYSYMKHNKILTSKLAKFVETEDAISNDSLEDNSHQQHRSISKRKQAKRVEGEDAVSYDSTKYSSLKQYRRIPRSKQAKRIERDDAVSNNVLAVNSHKQRARIPISKQTKCIEREYAESDDALDGNSHMQQRRIPTSKQAKCVEEEDEVSDDSLEDYSYQQHRRISKSNQAKSIEMEDAVSCDSLEDNFLQQHQRIPRSKQAKCIESEDAVSDDSLEDNSHQQHRRIPRSMLAKCIEREDTVSYDSLEDNSHQEQRSIPRKRQAKSVEREDEVSYDSPEDNSHRRQRRIPRKKQAKCIDREDAVSYDSLEDNSNQQQKRIPKSKQAKRVEREDAISCDSLEDSSHQQHRRILRSKQIKAQNLRQMKHKTPQHMKQGTRRLTKQEIPRQLKQETPRLPNDRNGQLDSYVEEDQEGGPSTRLRKRIPKPPKHAEAKPKEKKQAGKRKVKNASAVKAPAGYNNAKVKDEEGEYQCDMEGCSMSFATKQELLLHKRNICPVKGCGKKFFSHKYLVQHRRVHVDDRPLKCPWKGCKMTFKWAWARTEHIRVHTGARPYVCAEPGCGQTFRFVSDFSRHKRKTGHSAKKGRG